MCKLGRHSALYNAHVVLAELTERVVAFRRAYPLQSANEDAQVLDCLRAWQRYSPILREFGLLQQLNA